MTVIIYKGRYFQPFRSEWTKLNYYRFLSHYFLTYQMVHNTLMQES